MPLGRGRGEVATKYWFSHPGGHQGVISLRGLCGTQDVKRAHVALLELLDCYYLQLRGRLRCQSCERFLTRPVGAIPLNTMGFPPTLPFTAGLAVALGDHRLRPSTGVLNPLRGCQPAFRIVAVDET
jgi:hypothetical protein